MTTIPGALSTPVRPLFGSSASPSGAAPSAGTPSSAAPTPTPAPAAAPAPSPAPSPGSSSGSTVTPSPAPTPNTGQSWWRNWRQKRAQAKAAANTPAGQPTKTSTLTKVALALTLVGGGFLVSEVTRSAGRLWSGTSGGSHSSAPADPHGHGADPHATPDPHATGGHAPVATSGGHDPHATSGGHSPVATGHGPVTPGTASHPALNPLEGQLLGFYYKRAELVEATIAKNKKQLIAGIREQGNSFIPPLTLADVTRVEDAFKSAKAALAAAHVDYDSIKKNATPPNAAQVKAFGDYLRAGLMGQKLMENATPAMLSLPTGIPVGPFPAQQMHMDIADLKTAEGFEDAYIQLLSRLGSDATSFRSAWKLDLDNVAIDLKQNPWP